jgi:hypothetical protein
MKKKNGRGEVQRNNDGDKNKTAVLFSEYGSY